MEIACALFAIELIATIAYQKLKPQRNNTHKKITFLPYTKEEMPETLVTDCSHPTCLQITHHLKAKGQRAAIEDHNRGDSSTEGVLKSIRNNSTYLTNHKYVSTNHFDVDSLISVWCFMNQEKAKQYENIIYEIAKIGDFRELTLNEPYQYIALRLTCWLNSEERRLFFRAFEGKGYRVIKTINAGTTEEKRVEVDVANDESRDETNKLVYFLPLFLDVLESLASSSPNPLYLAQSEEEYNRVVSGYNLLNTTDSTTSTVEQYPQIALAIVKTPEPLHYYSLFSATHGLDIILTIYSGNRYELETKYTSHVDLVSRAVLPRVTLIPLAKVLNTLERQLSGHNSYLPYEWKADKWFEPGPILRLEGEYYLTKAERYGSPFERPIFPSLIPPERMQAIVLSYYRYAYTGVRAKKNWSTQEYIDFNRDIEERLATGEWTGAATVEV